MKGGGSASASGKGGSSSKKTPGSTSRYDSSLGLLTKKFVDLLQVRPHCTHSTLVPLGY